MKAMIMAAGFGSRLKPWTDSHPKALVPVDGVPALERQILRLQNYGFNELVVNVHHFADQIIDFIASKKWDARIMISDESSRILDTGGALLKALPMFDDISDGVLIHNVDIFSNVNPKELMDCHLKAYNDITLLTSPRQSSRRLVFNEAGYLLAWHNILSNQYRPADFIPEENATEEAFSGIYVVDSRILRSLSDYACDIHNAKFPIMDFLLSNPDDLQIRHCFNPQLKLLDIGKPEALSNAPDFLFD